MLKNSWLIPMESSLCACCKANMVPRRPSLFRNQTRKHAKEKIEASRPRLCVRSAADSRRSQAWPQTGPQHHVVHWGPAESHHNSALRYKSIRGICIWFGALQCKTLCSTTTLAAAIGMDSHRRSSRCCKGQAIFAATCFCRGKLTPQPAT